MRHEHLAIRILGVVILAIFLWAALACGAAGKITIEGPTQCEVDETIVLTIDGAKLNVTSSMSMDEIVARVRQVQVQHENEIVGVRVGITVVPDGFQLELETKITPTKPGITFVFVIDRTNKELTTLPVAFHAIQVGEVPGPDPPKPEKGPRYLLFLREKNPHTEALIEVAPQWEAFFNKLRQEEMAGAFKTHAIKDADDDAQETAYAPYLQGKDPKTGEPYRKNDDPTPTLFIIQRESPHKILWCGPSPKTLSTLKAKLTDFGG